MSSSKVTIAFAAVYIFWGATFLAMKWAVVSIPPYLMAGVRFLLAGGAMYLWSRWRGNPRPTRRHWISAAVVGALLMLLGNGNVAWAQRYVPSGLSAILVASSAIWIVLLDWWRPHGRRPRPMVVAGMVLGIAGIVTLVSARSSPDGARLDPFATTVLLLSAISWAAGSIISRHMPAPASWVQSTGMQMLCGGAFLVIVALIGGQARGFDPRSVTLQSLIGFLYLLIFGSIIGFTAYMWLLSRVSAAKVATYAYVNPIVAVFLGIVAGGERLTPRALVASALSLAGVTLVTLARDTLEQEPPEGS